LNESIKRIIERRKESRNYGGGLLGILLRGRGDEKKYQLTDSQVADNLIGVIFAAHDTTASVLTWVLKYLHDNPNLLETVTVSNSIFSFFFIFVIFLRQILRYTSYLNMYRYNIIEVNNSDRFINRIYYFFDLSELFNKMFTAVFIDY
jgi:cytochrome P450